MIDRDRAHLFLVGFMGTGKSTIAARVAGRLGMESVDLDAEIERRTGRTISEIFAESGEPEFRRLESVALARLDSHAPTVVALGGGTPESFANRRRMKQTGVTVWLDADLDELRRRVGAGTGRPRWKNKNSVDLRSFFERRRAVYCLADGRVPAVETDPDTVAAAVIAFFEGFFH